MPILAELPAPDSPQSIGWLVLTVFAFCGGAYYVIGCWEKLTGRSRHRKIQEPLEVRAASNYATVAQHEKLEKKVEADTAKATSARKGIYERLDAQSTRISSVETAQKSAEHEISSLDRKIEENTKLTSEMRGEVRAMNQSVQNLTSSLTQFLQNAARK